MRIEDAPVLDMERGLPIGQNYSKISSVTENASI